MNDLTMLTGGLAFPEGPDVLPDGSLVVAEIARGCLTGIERERALRVAGTCGGPDGIGPSPDGAVLSVAATPTGRPRSWPVLGPGTLGRADRDSPATGTLVAGLPGFGRFRSRARGACGTIAAACLRQVGVAVTAPDGRLIERVRTDAKAGTAAPKACASDLRRPVTGMAVRARGAVRSGQTARTSAVQPVAEGCRGARGARIAGIPGFLIRIGLPVTPAALRLQVATAGATDAAARRTMTAPHCANLACPAGAGAVAAAIRRAVSPAASVGGANHV